MAAMFQILCQFHYIDALKSTISTHSRRHRPAGTIPHPGLAGTEARRRWPGFCAQHIWYSPFVHLLTLAAVLTADLAVAQNQAGETANVPPRKVVAVVPRSWPPQYDHDEEGKPVGFAIDVMNEIAARAGITVTYKVAKNFSEAEEILNRGEADLIPNSGILPERMGTYAFTAPVETFVVSIFVRRNTRDINGVSELVGRSLAVVEKNIGLFMFGKRQDIDVQVFPDVRSALFQLVAGQVDALVYPQPVILNLTRQIGIEDQIKVVGEPLKEIKRGIRVMKDNVALLAILNEAVEGFVGTPAYQRTYTKWYGKPKPFWTAVRIIWTMGGLLVVILVAMASWRHRSVVKLNRELGETITARKRAEKEIAAKSALLETTFEGMSQGISVVDADHKFVAFNQQYVDLWGYPPGFLRLGMPTEDVIRFKAERGDYGSCDVESKVTERMRTLRRGEANESEFALPNGKIIYFSRNPLPDGGAVTTYTDITERKRAEEALRESEARLVKAQRIAHLGSWERNIEAGEVHWSDQMYDIFAITPEQFAGTHEAFIERVHPDDRELVKEADRMALNEGAPFDVEYRIIRPDTSERVIHAHGEVEFDADGKPRFA